MTDHPEAKSFKLLTISAEKFPASMGRQAEIDSYAAERARLLLGCYRTGEANDPQTYVAAITAVLSRYPVDVITAVTHPVTGLPIEVKWLPSVLEVREACERAMLPIRSQVAREKRIAEQIETRRREDEARAERPSFNDLKTKYGPDWGLSSAPKATGPAPTAPTVEQLRHHYQHYDLAFKAKNHGELEDHIDRGFSPATV